MMITMMAGGRQLEGGISRCGWGKKNGILQEGRVSEEYKKVTGESDVSYGRRPTPAEAIASIGK